MRWPRSGSCKQSRISPYLEAVGYVEMIHGQVELGTQAIAGKVGECVDYYAAGTVVAETWKSREKCMLRARGEEPGVALQPWTGCAALFVWLFLSCSHDHAWADCCPDGHGHGRHSWGRDGANGGQG